MERILYVTSTRIGDAVLASGVLAHLADARPDARFTVAAGPLAAPLFRGAPRVDDVIVMTKRKSGGHWFDLWRATVGRRWDEVVDLRGSRTSWFLRAGRRRIAGRPRTDVHKVDEAARAAGLDAPAAPRLWLDAAARAAADAALDGVDRFLALAPAASAPFKEWPPQAFAEAANALTGDGGALAGAAVVILGGPGDARTSAAVAERLDRPARDLTGDLDILAAAAVLERAALFVGNDSGLMHLAAAAGAPTLGLFGPTDERVYGPWGARARAVRAGAPADASRREQLRHAAATMMDDLPVGAVVEAAARLLEKTETADA